jgi:hypothetical protein
MFNRTARILCTALVAVVALVGVMYFTGLLDAHAIQVIAKHAGSGVVGLAGFPVISRTYNDLLSIGRPVAASEPEAIPGMLFDTMTWLAAGQPKGLKFFQKANPASNESNVSNGKLDAGYAFQAYAFRMDLLRTPTFTANVVAGAINDLELFLKANQTFFVFSQNSKPWPAIPATAAHGTGGTTGFVAASYTAPQNMQYANNGVFDAGFETDGSLCILPQVPFSVTLAGIDPAVALAADLVIRFCIVGTWYRPVS